MKSDYNNYKISRYQLVPILLLAMVTYLSIIEVFLSDYQIALFSILSLSLIVFCVYHFTKTNGIPRIMFAMCIPVILMVQYIYVFAY